jgi:CoA:oxalate CoA-transferase
VAKALDNVRVLDFTRALAGPFCTMLLQQFGAEVIKIEIPGGGDMTRTSLPFTEAGESYYFININRSKKSITLNLSTDKGREIIKKLVLKADVVVENFSPGVMDRLRLSYDELSKINPSLIYASVSGFGNTGPYSSRPAFDVIAQAMGGMMSVTGFPDNPPTKAGPFVGDNLGGIYTTVAILAALHHKERNGQGQRIDISMQDCVWAVTAPGSASLYFLNGQIPPRCGNAAAVAVPFGTYPTRDGYVVICVGPVEQWEDFVKAIGRQALIGDPRFATMKDRSEHKDEVNEIVTEWTKTITTAEAVTKLIDARVPASPVPTFDEVVNDPQLLSRQMIVEVEQPLSGKLKVLGSVFKLSGTPGEPGSPSPFLGEHNYEVYSEMLGYTEEEINKLADDGII